MAITAAMVKDLREKTQAGMMDCKKALNETGGDLEAAADWLRKKGIAKAGKKASRIAAEGLVAAESNGTKGVVVEVNSETDFVARNDQFQDVVARIAKRGLHFNTTEELANAEFEGGKSTTEYLTELVGTIGENMSFRRMESLEVPKGVVASYIHNAVKPGMGKIGVLVALESDNDAPALEELAKKIAMHVAATSPLANTVDDLDDAIVSKEREMLKAEALESGKPENIVDKMVEGRMQKFFKESVLATQVFVMDGERTVEKVLEDEGKALGSDIKLAGFVRMAVGEGIEKKEENFAEEVMAAAKG